MPSEKAERDMLPTNGTFTRLGALGCVRYKRGQVQKSYNAKGRVVMADLV